MKQTETEKTQLGMVMVFKMGTTKAQIEKALALKGMKEILDYPPRINEFNPDWGGPVFYVP